MGKPRPSIASYPIAIVEALLVEHQNSECYCLDEKTHACGWCAVEALLNLSHKED